MSAYNNDGYHSDLKKMLNNSEIRTISDEITSSDVYQWKTAPFTQTQRPATPLKRPSGFASPNQRQACFEGRETDDEEEEEEEQQDDDEISTLNSASMLSGLRVDDAGLHSQLPGIGAVQTVKHVSPIIPCIPDIKTYLKNIGLGDIAFEDVQLIMKGVVHPSKLQADRASQMDFQRKEWLGDALLYSSASQVLYHQFPEYEEERLSRLRTLVVRESSLAAFARATGFDRLIVVGNGTDLVDAVLADTVEAFVGTIFTEMRPPDNSIKSNALCEAILNFVLKNLPGALLSAKATLNEWSIAALGVSPVYDTEPLDAFGSTISKTQENSAQGGWKCRVTVGHTISQMGSGKSKSEAEERAALAVFANFKTGEGRARHSVALPQHKSDLLSAVNAAGLGQVLFQVMPTPGPCNLPFIVKASIPYMEVEQHGYGETRKEAEFEASMKMLSALQAMGHIPQVKVKASPNPQLQERPWAGSNVVNGQILVPQSSYSGLRPASNVTISRSTSSTSPGDFNQSVVSSTAPPVLGSNSKGNLQELLAKMRLDYPEYRHSKSGPDHQPKFHTEVYIQGNFYGSGDGFSKKEAEDAAARQALKKLSGGQLKTSTGDAFSGPTSFGDYPQNSKLDSRPTENPIGDLQILLDKVRFDLPRPVYELYRINENMFECKCTIGRYTSQGSGTSKQKAKHAAANNMYQQLVD